MSIAIISNRCKNHLNTFAVMAPTAQS